MPKFTVTTLGCKVNRYEAEAICRTLREAGLSEADGSEAVALCVVHSCCVTSTAAQKCRQIVRRVAEKHPGAKLVVTGCYATTDAEALRHLAGVTAVVGHHDDIAEQLTRLAGSLIRTPSNPSIRPFPARNVKGFHPRGTGNLIALDRFSGRHRAIVKVQDGCDGFCNYCIVAHIRDRLWSRPVEQITAEVVRLVNAGHREIVLCGVNLGSYGRETVHRPRWDDPADRLAAMVDAVADAAGAARVRLSSLNPPDVTDSLLELMARRATICPHLHISLQSGSTAILQRMNRRYTAEEFIATVDRIRSALDTPAITTDVIVGFPGETDADFDATLDVARHAGFAKIHTFPFSPREGTPAAQWESERPPGAVVRQRIARLAALEADLARAYRETFIGRNVDVLLEEAMPGNVAAGLTSRYQRVEVTKTGCHPLGEIVPVRIDGLGDEGLVGHRRDRRQQER